VAEPAHLRLVERQTRAFNHGVRTGEWAPLVALFAQTESEGKLTAAFAWASGGTGRMLVEHRDGAIERLTVVFDEH
jgi:hypothetical protein